MIGPENSVQDSVKVFGRGDDPDQQAKAVSTLMKLKQLHRAAKEPTFAEGIQRASVFAANGSDEQRLSATATLLRIAGLVKGLEAKVSGHLTTALTKPLPSLASVPDPDDRFYVATLWRHANHSWISSYLAASAVAEDLSEKVRAECLEGLISLHANLASALESLTTPLRRLDFQTEKRGDSKGKRLRRVLQAVTTAYNSSAKEPGHEAGENLMRLLSAAFQQTGVPNTEGVLREVSEEALGLVHAIVRARFSTATLSGTYSALDTIRGWFRLPEWQRFAEQSVTAQIIARDLSEAIELLVRAGVSDDSLYSYLTISAGSAELAREYANEILNRNPGLPDDLARWLSGLPVRRKSILAAENQLTSFDESIADLMIDSTRVRNMLEIIQRDVLPELNVMVPRSSESIEALVGMIRSEVNSIDAMTRARSLLLLGELGAIVDFSPLEHSLVGGLQPGVRSVRIIKQGVASPNEAGGKRVVRKAIVEPWKD